MWARRICDTRARSASQLSCSRSHGQGADGVRCRVHPALVPIDVPMAKVNGVLNAVELNGDLLGPLWLQGQRGRRRSDRQRGDG